MLGVSGGIASYKTVWLARLLTQAGAEVDVVLTRAAREFVGAVTFEAVTGRRVYTDLFEPGGALDHIRLASEAHAIVVAPATADLMARAAHGHADDLLTACLLAAGPPVLFVAAMNDRMWANPQTQANATSLRERDHLVLVPETGDLAYGEGSGPGRMPEPETLFEHIGRLLEPAGGLTGKRIVVSAGATREPIDPVRFISNHSTGKMGVAVAAAAWRRGADVTLVAGHLDVSPPPAVYVTRVGTTEEMRDALREAVKGADALVMAAAPADFRPAEPADRKIEKAQAGSVAMKATPDILSEIARTRPKRLVVVGFALETGDAETRGRHKLASKDLDLIVINDQLEEGAGFGGDTNRVTLVTRSGASEELPLQPKSQVADRILDRLEAILSA